MKIAVIGTGYVGLVAGAGFSDFGNDVVCVDIDEARVTSLRQGQIPFYEPHLESLVKRNVRDNRLSFTTDTETAVAGADAVFLCVGTPSTGAGNADLSYIETAARAVGRGLTGWAVVVCKSTVPVGTVDRVRAIVAEHTEHDFAVASNPEFLKEGDAVNDFMKPERIILGVDDQRALATLRRLYAPLQRVRERLHIMDIRSAELAKYAANSMLATRISLMNEVALLAERVGADIERVRAAVGSDQRIGSKYLYAGAGFGGSCFPKDLRALGRIGREHGADMTLVEAVQEVNERQKRVLGERVLSHYSGDLKGRRIGVWGLAFKPQTDDIREAPALVLIDQLLAAGAEVTAYDPAASERVAEIYGDRIALPGDMYMAAEDADALVLVTEWRQFRRPSFSRLRASMRALVLFDGRNVWDPAELTTLGFSYYGIGRSERALASASATAE